MTGPRSFSRRWASRRAVTLLELLVALALSSMIMLMVATTIATSVRAAGSTVIDEQQGRREDRGRTLLGAQLSWIELHAESREPRAFLGQTAFLEFASLVSARTPHRRDPVRVRYAAAPALSGEGLRLVYMEWPGIRQQERAVEADVDFAIDALREHIEQDADAETTRAAPQVAYTVIDGCSAVQFSYLYIGSGNERVWDLLWRESRALPRAVRLSWTTLEGVEGEWIVPVVATF